MASFKARARTLDMLGRQQIAGIPTAISELFKNAHDAYADTVEVDYFRLDDLFILRDDGLGMSKEEFEERWLTLGTESKLGVEGISPPPKDKDKPTRPILGEKGIGRLAIASIGPQVLVLTRAKNEKNPQDLVAAFINWGLFELPGIDLDQITVPLRTFSGGKIPEMDEIKEMVDDVITNVNTLQDKGKISDKNAKRLLKQLKQFDLDPIKYDGYFERLSLKDKGNDTHFYILPADDLLQSVIDGDKKTDTASPLTKMLIGFTNTMTPDAPEPKIKASFRDHKTTESYEELISDSEFFTPDEFKMADHHFKGEFDEHGQFKGSVNVYGELKRDYILPWIRAKGKKTLCGPFKINVAYVQGAPADTKITPLEHAHIMAKLNRIGGVYIYKEGVRILPYGDSDYDFLDIEKRRTKGAGYYYFSYRRMFGVIEILKDKNQDLIEKAGREGFIENKAYKQFRDILENFFIQLAGDYFRTQIKGGGPAAEFWDRRREELDKIHKAQQLREKKAKGKKYKFSRELNDFFGMLEKDYLKNEIDKILSSLNQNFSSAAKIKNPDKGAQAFLDAEAGARKELDDLKNTYRVIRARGFVPGKELEFAWNAYLIKARELEIEYFTPASTKIEELANNAVDEFKLDVNRRRRLERALDDIIDQAKRTTNSESRETRDSSKTLNNNIINLTREIMSDMEVRVNQVKSELAKIDVLDMNDSELVSERTRLESLIISEEERNKDILDSIQAQIEGITWSKVEDGDIITSVDISESMEEEINTLKERADLDLQLSQLGLAVGVIHHEFGGTVKAIRQNIRRLKAWSDVNEKLRPIHDNIRNNFDHLDGYLTLFTPLNRRLYRNEVDITGSGIKDFLDDIFMQRKKRHGVEIESTAEFLKKTISGYPSTFYPVFVNVVDNAFFWLKDIKGEKKILLDADEKGFYISNNGLEIPLQDREIIFELGFTRKPNGRGMGLYISREVLQKEGYRIYITEPRMSRGVTFRIEKIEDGEDS